MVTAATQPHLWDLPDLAVFGRRVADAAGVPGRAPGSGRRGRAPAGCPLDLSGPAGSRRLPGVMFRPPDESRLWVFSDPPFEHEASVAIFGRPFRGCHHGDSCLLEQWTREVMDHDTVICLGDVTMGRPTDGLIDRLRRRPGRKVLVAGNRDHAHIRRLRRAFEVVACAHLEGEPDLLFTHVPLNDVPVGCVNVHGHVHRKTSVDARRINVCVEQTGYRPVPVSDVRRLARRLARVPLGGNATTDLFIAWAKGWPEAGEAAGQGAAP